jgi:hypothetical protein
MATPLPTPTIYYPNQGSYQKRWMKTHDANVTANQGSSKWEATPTPDPAQ